MRVLIVFLIGIIPLKLFSQFWNTYQSTSIGQYYGIYMHNNCNGFAVGAQYTFHETNDGGRTWANANATALPQYLDGVWFINANKGWAWGYNGTIYYTLNGGISWSKSVFFGSYPIYDVNFIDSLNGFACSTGFIFISTDGGVNWTTKPIAALSGISLTGIRFMNKAKGFITCQDTIYSTNDSGNTWQSNLTTTGYSLNGIEQINSNTLVAYDNQGNIITSHNSGLSWSVMSLGTGSAITNHYKINSDSIYLCSDYGYIENHDGGYGWGISWAPVGVLGTVNAIAVTNEQIIEAGYTQIGPAPYYTTWLKDSTICITNNSELSIASIDIYTIQSNDYIFIKGLKNDINWLYTITDLNGKIIVPENQISENGSIQISTLSHSIYFLHIKNSNFTLRKTIKFVH